VTAFALPTVARADLAWPLLNAARAAADPSAATRRFASGCFTTAAEFDVLCIGKAAVTMAQAAQEPLGDRLIGGLVVAPDGAPVGDTFAVRPATSLDHRWRVLRSDHPMPTARSLAAADAVFDFVAAGSRPLLVLLSGGGSALMVRPAAGLSLADLREVSDGLMRAGAGIDELNAVRKHIDLTKGGRLGLAAGSRSVSVGVISDVLGDRLDVISSGPFAADPTTFDEAWRVLRARGIGHPSVRAVLESGRAGLIPETPKPGAAELAHIQHTILAGNAMVTRAVAETLGTLGLSDLFVLTEQRGEARAWGERAASMLMKGASAVVIGGESVVSGVKPGRLGGPVQEAVLTAALGLVSRGDWLVLGYATDGIDGPTDAAGAVLDPALLSGVTDAAGALREHHVTPALDAAGALLRTGPSGTNLNAVLVALRAPGGNGSRP
jgi:hydroxypyruvate reductase